MPRLILRIVSLHPTVILPTQSRRRCHLNHSQGIKTQLIQCRHRQQAKHSCPGPLDYTHRSEAALARKSQAQSILAKHFPEAVGRVIPKPPAGRDVQRPRPKSPEKLPPSLSQPTVSSNDCTSSSTTIGNEKQEDKKVKTKNEKLYDIHLKKIRSLAVPLDKKQKADGRDRRFFEISLGEAKLVEVDESWRGNGKWAKVERVWVLSVRASIYSM